MSEQTKQPWDRTKWLLLIAILMIVEGFVFYAAMENSKSSSALGYISFAGTVTSIILAVLAIIYGFVQNYSQERKSDSITEQMIRLKEVIDSLVSSKMKLGSEIDKFEVIAEQINKLDTSLSKEMKSTHSKLDSLVTARSENVEEFNLNVFRVLIENKNIFAGIAALLYLSKSKSIHYDDVEDFYMQVRTKRLKEKNPSFDIDYLEGVSQGMWIASLNVLQGIGAIFLREDNDGAIEDYEINNSASEELEKLIGNLKAMDDVDVNRFLSLVDAFLKGEE